MYLARSYNLKFSISKAYCTLNLAIEVFSLIGTIFVASNDSMRISFMGYSFLEAVTKIVSRGYKKIVYSRKINRKCCQRFVKTAAKFQDNIFKIEKIWATEFIDINIPTKLATSLTIFTICLLIRIIYKINGLYYTVNRLNF